MRTQTQIVVTISDSPDELGFSPHDDAEAHMEMGLSALAGSNVQVAIRPVDARTGCGTRVLLWVSPQPDRIDLTGPPNGAVENVVGVAMARQLGVEPSEVDVSVSNAGPIR